MTSQMSESAADNGWLVHTLIAACLASICTIPCLLVDSKFEHPEFGLMNAETGGQGGDGPPPSGRKLPAHGVPEDAKLLIVLVLVGVGRTLLELIEQLKGDSSAISVVAESRIELQRYQVVCDGHLRWEEDEEDGNGHRTRRMETGHERRRMWDKRRKRRRDRRRRRMGDEGWAEEDGRREEENDGRGMDGGG